MAVTYILTAQATSVYKVDANKDRRELTSGAVEAVAGSSNSQNGKLLKAPSTSSKLVRIDDLDTAAGEKKYKLVKKKPKHKKIKMEVYEPKYKYKKIKMKVPVKKLKKKKVKGYMVKKKHHHY